jgi:hypothetical protein
MEAYGIGPLNIRLLRNTWEGSGVVPRKAGRYQCSLFRIIASNDTIVVERQRSALLHSNIGTFDRSDLVDA